MTPSTVFDHIAQPYGFEALQYRQRQQVARVAVKAYQKHKQINSGFGKIMALEAATIQTRYLTAINQDRLRRQRCGARTRKGRPCKMKELGPSGRCKFHGGQSTGPKTLEGRIKSLSRLKQYRDRPDLLAARVAEIQGQRDTLAQAKARLSVSGGISGPILYQRPHKA